jgi:glycosidase
MEPTTTPASGPQRPAARLLPGVLASCLLFVAASQGAGETRDPPPDPPVASAAARSAAGNWENDWARGSVFYEIFVRSFADSDGDGIGDLRGLISKLDYLNDGNPSTTRDLGIDGIWLMPVFESPSYHGYDTTDYYRIDPDYGSNADFELLLTEAHRRGIRVIVDLMVNHTSILHPWFLESAISPTSARRDWYVWRPSDPGWTQPWGGNHQTWHPSHGDSYYHGIFWAGMPDLNFRHREVREEVKRLAAHWLERGVDGFRLDAARHLIEVGDGSGQNDSPETHAYWREFAAFVRAIRPDALLIGEVWSDTPSIAGYYGSTEAVRAGDELPMNFNFPLSGSIIAAVRAQDAGGIAATLAGMAEHYPDGVLDGTFLTNHDMVRLATQLEEDSNQMRIAAALLLTLPGTPFLYYGEEVGLVNGPTQGDESKRTPMPWDATLGGGFTSGAPWFLFAPGKREVNVAAGTDDPGSLLSHYRDLIRARKSSTALATGAVELLAPAGDSAALLAFVRDSGAERALVLHNLGGDPVEAGPFALPASRLERLFGDAGVGEPRGEAGAWRISLPPYSSGIWVLR